MCVYIRADICFNHRFDHNYKLIESVWSNALLTKNKPLLIDSFYGSPDQNNYQLLEESFISCKDCDKVDIIMTGNFYTDVSVQRMACSRL